VSFVVVRNRAGIPQMLGEPQRRAVERKCPACQAGTLCLIGWIPPGIPRRLPERS
jgi:hypothetical protein